MLSRSDVRTVRGTLMEGASVKMQCIPGRVRPHNNEHADEKNQRQISRGAYQESNQQNEHTAGDCQSNEANPAASRDCYEEASSPHVNLNDQYEYSIEVLKEHPYRHE